MALPAHAQHGECPMLRSASITLTTAPGCSSVSLLRTALLLPPATARSAAGLTPAAQAAQQPGHLLETPAALLQLRAGMTAPTLVSAVQQARRHHHHPAACCWLLLLQVDHRCKQCCQACCVEAGQLLLGLTANGTQLAGRQWQLQSREPRQQCC
ncbi:hypothetical protein COO60DRAFT_558942 [Scenedesmus sp. NREL 46B-D3]|nr:hypothetical protein COO60DRAFT_558942 [Scenedesmus sp. NREL 46B-D3]